MPELPEVEVLVRHLDPILRGAIIDQVTVRRAKLLRPTTMAAFSRRLRGARFLGVSRRGKYLQFRLQTAGTRQPLVVVGHLGMTGRMWVQPAGRPWPPHTAVALGLGRREFIFEDPRGFGRFTLEASALDRLGPDPTSAAFSAAALRAALAGSAQPIKIKLLDQSRVAGIGNIYASEALFGARLSPQTPARDLTALHCQRLWLALRRVLAEAIAAGSTAPLDWEGTGGADGFFYFGRGRPAPAADYVERLRVYQRAGQPCVRCGTIIRRIIQGGRSTFYCPACQV